MPCTEIVVITVAAGDTIPVPFSIAGASQVLIVSDGPADVLLQLTASPTDINFFTIMPQINAGVQPNIIGSTDEYWYVRGAAAHAGFTVRILIMRRS